MWNAADPTTAARCPLCRGPCCIAEDEIPRLQICWANADEEIKALSARLSVALHRARWSRNRCEDLIAVLLHFQDEVDIYGGHEPRLQLGNFAGLAKLAESPGRFQQLLHGPLRDLLWRRLALEDGQLACTQQTYSSGGARSSSSASGVSPYQTWINDVMSPVGYEGIAGHNFDESSPTVEEEGGALARADDREGHVVASNPNALHVLGEDDAEVHLHDAWDSQEDAAQYRNALNTEILALTLDPCAEGDLNPDDPEENMLSLDAALKELGGHRQHLALLLCTAGDRAEGCSLGRPWQSEPSVGRLVNPVVRREAMEHRISLRRRMMLMSGHRHRYGDNRHWSMIVRLLRELVETEATMPSQS